MSTNNVYEERISRIVRKVKTVMPEIFVAHTSDEKIRAFAELVLADLNYWPPMTNYRIENLPEHYEPVLVFGCNFFAALFWQMGASLQDFDFNDNGFTVRVDQVSKVGTSLANLATTYLRMIENVKVREIFRVGPKGLITPRYHSALGQFLKIALGDAFTSQMFNI